MAAIAGDARATSGWVSRTFVRCERARRRVGPVILLCEAAMNAPVRSGSARAGHERHREALWRRACAARRRFRPARGRGPCAARRERRRQVDADEHPWRRHRARPRRDSCRRRARALRQPARRAGERHRHHLPGTRPGAGPRHHREPVSRARTDAAGRASRQCARWSGRRARAWPRPASKSTCGGASTN